MSKKTTKFAHAPHKKPWLLIGSGVFFLFLVLSSLGLVLFQKPFQQESQDLRQQAMQADGQISLSFSPSAGGTLTSGQAQTIQIQANTQGQPLTGIELVFNVVLQDINLASAPELVVPNTTGLTLIEQEVQETNDGYLVRMVLFAPPNSNIGFNAPTTFAQLSFTPQNTGSLALNFDVQNSIAFLSNATTPEDELKTIETVSYTIASTQGTPTCEYTYSDWGTCVDGTQTRTVASKTPDVCSGEPVLSQSCTVDPGSCTYTYGDWSTCSNGQQTRTVTSQSPEGCTGTPTTSRSCTTSQSCTYTYSDWSSCADGTQTRTVTAQTPAEASCSNNPVLSQSCQVGGVSYKSCNEICTSNDECAPNYRCYDLGGESRCRLVTNVSSNSCATSTTTTDTGDDGLNRSCNQYCANSGECRSGLTCYYNRCRQPQNVDSQTCAAPTLAQTQSIAQNCNAACASNNDCANNMRCYYGSCRLATNPSSTSCSAPTQQKVSQSVYGQPKGGSNAQEGSDSQSQTATSGSNFLRPSSSPTARPGMSPLPTVAPDATAGDNQPGDSANDSSGVSLPEVLMALGGLGIILAIIFMIVRFLRRRPPQKPGSGSAGTPQDPAQTAAYEQSLQEKIDALKRPGVAQPTQPTQQTTPPVLPATPPRPTTPAVTTTSTPPTAPQVAPTPVASTTPPVKPQAQETPVFSQSAPVAATTTSPTASAPTPSPAASSMIDRIRQKGIQAPTEKTD